MAKVMKVEKPRDFDPPAHWAIVGTGSGKCVLQFFLQFFLYDVVQNCGVSPKKQGNW